MKQPVVLLFKQRRNYKKTLFIEWGAYVDKIKFKNHIWGLYFYHSTNYLIICVNNKNIL